MKSVKSKQVEIPVYSTSTGGEERSAIMKLVLDLGADIDRQFSLALYFNDSTVQVVRLADITDLGLVSWATDPALT